MSVFAADPLYSGDIDLAVVLITVLKGVITLGFALIATSLFIWIERKLISDFQARVGPNRAGPYGILQTIADGAKLFLKEGMVPTQADRLVFRLAPYFAAVPAFFIFSVVPITGDFGAGGDGTIELFGRTTYAQLYDGPIGILVVLVASSIAVYGVMLAGWASGSKYPLLGAVRASASMISYEAALGLSLAAVVLYAGSLSTHDMVMVQAGEGPGGILPNWNLIALGIVPFAVFFTAALAEMNRPPFDLTEAEQELVAGFNTEYSGIRFALFYIAEFMAPITFGGVMTTLFFGGPAGPVPVGPTWLWGLIWFFVKLAAFLFVFVWLRATLPRVRYDRLMDLGWKLLIPLSLGWLLLLAALRVADVEGWNRGVVTVAGGAGLLAGAALVSAAVRSGRRRHELDATGVDPPRSDRTGAAR